MIMITPSTWPYAGSVPTALVSGDRCVYIYDYTTGYNLAKAGIPNVKVTLRDWAVMHRTHTGPSGEITFRDATQVTANLPSTWDGT